jgi:TRAP-type C4-dicarboxylate transport system permease small subunit
LAAAARPAAIEVRERRTPRFNEPRGENVLAARSSSGPAPSRPRLIKILFDNLEELVALVLLAVIGVVIAIQVFVRTVLSAPLSWPEELSQFLFVWASVLGAVGAAKRLGLVRMETIAEKLPAGLRPFAELSILVVVGALLAVLGWQGSQMAARTTYAATTLPITWAWMYSAATAFAVLVYARIIQAQLFKYRFTFVESVLADRRGAIDGGSRAS